MTDLYAVKYVKAKTANNSAVLTPHLAAELLDDPAAYDRMAKAVNPYGDGKACPRIAQAILSHFLDAQPPEPFVPAH